MDASPGTSMRTAGPLAGVNVLDLGTMISGPMVSTLLGDFGADVVKVELPGKGDPMRDIGNSIDGVNLAWLIAGRNKRSVTLDLRAPRGREVLLDLIKHFDIVVENFRPGTLERWNLGEKVLRESNPDMVFVRISGYGQDGPKGTMPGFDGVALAYGGVTFLTGYPESPPSRCGVPVADYSTAYNGALAAMMALYHRDVHAGGGQTIDLALFETIFGMTRELVTQYELTGELRERHGNSNPQIAPGGCFQTRDGQWLMLAGSNDNTWQRLAQAMGRPELAEDPRYATNAGRIEDAGTLNDLLSSWVREQTMDDAVELLTASGVPATGVYSAADIAKDDHYAVRSVLISRTHPVLGEIRIPGIPARLSVTPGAVDWLGPEVGEHTEQVYSELLGLPPDELRALRAEKVI